MEFLYRAVDERQSRSPPPPAAPSTPGSGSADGHGSDAPAERVGNSAVTLWQPDLPPPETAAVDADELQRQARKARIKERILREEAEHWELELEAHPKASALATALAKRKSPDRATGASTVSLAPSSSKKQKSHLTCTVCGITANSEKAMQDHLNGKVHKRKVVAVALPELPKLVPETEQERGPEAGEEEEAMAMETLGDYYKPTKFKMATNAGALSEVTQMDGYLLCELCNVRTIDRITMMCHLQGSKHISNDQKTKKRQASSKPSGADPNKKLVLEDDSVPLPHTVRRLEGFLLCQLCDVKAPSMNGMRQHLSGKKHKNKANTSSSDASVVNASTGGKEATKAQPIHMDMAVISDNMAAEVEATLAKKSLQLKLGDDSELQEMTVAPPKEDVPIGDSTKTPGTEMMKSSATSAGAQLNNVYDSYSLTMEVDSVMHPLQRVDGFLVCLSCNAKALSETIMQSHLVGKKHKRKMALAAARGNNDLSVLATGANDNSSKSTKGNLEAQSAAPQAKAAANEEAESAPSLAVSETKNISAMASMAVDGPVNAQLATCITEPAEEGEITEEAEEEHAAADTNNGSVTQSKESVIIDDTNSAAGGKPIKIQVEGKVFTVTQQGNGRLSCELCGVHSCDKDSMILHLYTSTHWGKASRAEKKGKEQACMAAAAMVDKDGEVGSGSMAGEGSGVTTMLV